jgi:uncharacterized protein (DUF427 family)
MRSGEHQVARATWNGAVVAQTRRPVVVEGNVYFPPEDVRAEHLARTRARSVCPWKGLARRIRNHVAFWNGVQVDIAPERQDKARAES